MKRVVKVLAWLFLGILIYPQGYYIFTQNNQNVQVSQGPYKGIGVYLINLDRSPERLAYVKPQLEKLGWPFERVPGVDGSRLSEEEINKLVDAKAYQKYMGHLPQRGMIGCNMSHAKVWQTFLQSSYEYALIFEDDVSFNPEELRSVVNDLIKSHKGDIVCLEPTHWGMPLDVQKLVLGHQEVIYLTEITHAGGYILNRKAAHALLSKFFPIQMAIDHYFTRSWEFDLTFTGVEPRLVRQTMGTSEIGKSKRIERAPMPFHVYMERGIIKLQSYIIRFAYNLKRFYEI